MGRVNAAKNEAKAAAVDTVHAAEHAIKTPVKAVTGNKHGRTTAPRRV